MFVWFGPPQSEMKAEFINSLFAPRRESALVANPVPYGTCSTFYFDNFGVRCIHTAHRQISILMVERGFRNTIHQRSHRVDRFECCDQCEVQTFIEGFDAPFERQPNGCTAQVRFKRRECLYDACNISLFATVDYVEVKSKP